MWTTFHIGGKGIEAIFEKEMNLQNAQWHDGRRLCSETSRVVHLGEEVPSLCPQSQRTNGTLTTDKPKQGEASSLWNSLPQHVAMVSEPRRL